MTVFGSDPDADGDEDAALMYLVGHPRPTNPARRLAKVAEAYGDDKVDLAIGPTSSASGRSRMSSGGSCWEIGASRRIAANAG